MSNRKILAALAFLGVYTPFLAHAVVFGGSNLGFSGYPEPSISEPLPPYNNSQASMDNYRMQVESYVSGVKEYSENAGNDIKRIQEARQNAIDNANRVVENYNRAARGY